MTTRSSSRTAGLHPVVARAAAGELPSWAEAAPERRAHMERVARLLSGWGRALGLPEQERLRWRAAAWLHDALRDADPAGLKGEVPGAAAGLPGPVLHGPAVAERLRREGVGDEELLTAVAYHTLGHPSFRALGKALYAADFLDPGRRFRDRWRARLRAGYPRDPEAVLLEVVAARLRHRLEREVPIRPETLGFWNALVDRGGE